MSNFEVVVISLVAVFVGLAMLSFIISLFPLVFKPKAAAAPAGVSTAPAAAAAPAEDPDELLAVMMAAAAYEEDERPNPLIRNYEGA